MIVQIWVKINYLIKRKDVDNDDDGDAYNDQNQNI
jgi:hypothetical protein